MNNFLSFFLYPFWYVKKNITLSKDKFVIDEINENFTIIRENRRNRMNGGAKTEDDHLSIFNENKLNFKSKVIMAYGFNSLLYYCLKIKSRNEVIIYYTHDLYYKRIEGNLLKMFHFYLHYKLIKLNVDIILHCNLQEVQELRNIVDCKVFWFPARTFNVDKLPKKRITHSNINLLLIGSQEHQLNVIHTRNFIKEIFPFLRQNFSGIQLNIVGMHASLFSEEIYEDVIFHGIISDSDLNILIERCNIGISPIPIFSGVNIKCLDYLFNGLCVICHESAKYSIEQSGSDGVVMYANKMQQWINQINNLILENSMNGSQSDHLAQMYSKNNFEIIFQSVLDAIDESKAC